MTDVTRLFAWQMAEGLRRGDFTALELLEAHASLIERQNRALHAWVSLDLERARERARSADERFSAARGRTEGSVALPALLGIPIALKDLVVTLGRPSTAGSRILDGYVGSYAACIAQRLDEAGAVVPGKTNMDEFAMGSSTEHSSTGPTANPWDLGCVPGGSSGGSAAAV